MDEIELKVVGTLWRCKGHEVNFFYCTNIGVFIYYSELKTWSDTHWTFDRLVEATKEGYDFHPISKLQFLVETGQVFDEFQVRQTSTNEPL